MGNEASAQNGGEEGGLIIEGLETPESEIEFSDLCERKVKEALDMLSWSDWQPIAFGDDPSGKVQLFDKPGTEENGLSILKVVTTIQCPAAAVMELVSSLDLETLQTFEDQTLDVRVLREINESTQVVLRHIKSPSPLSNREVAALRHTRVLEDGTHLLLGCSINVKGLPETPSFVRANALVACWHITPNPDGSCTVVRLGQVDPRGSIPLMVVNAFKQKGGLAILKLKVILEKKFAQ
ncbi:MAG: START domain-containing protein [archaeon]|nr:START domain-containing protein [archaeon]